MKTHVRWLGAFRGGHSLKEMLAFELRRSDEVAAEPCQIRGNNLYYSVRSGVKVDQRVRVGLIMASPFRSYSCDVWSEYGCKPGQLRSRLYITHPNYISDHGESWCRGGGVSAMLIYPSWDRLTDGERAMFAKTSRIAGIKIFSMGEPGYTKKRDRYEYQVRIEEVKL